MKDVTAWSVKELKRYLHGSGVDTRGYKEKVELIDLATTLLHQDEKTEWMKNVTTLIVICISVLLLNVYVRPRIERVFWMNPKWLLSWIVLHCLYVIEKLLLINVILSWILPANLRQYNFIDLWLIKKWQPFPLSVPLNYDSQTQTASLWIDMYPMLLLYALRKLESYLTMYYHFMWFNQYRASYYESLGIPSEDNIYALDDDEHHYRDAQPLHGNNQDGYEADHEHQNDEINDGDEVDSTAATDHDMGIDHELQQALLASMQQN